MYECISINTHFVNRACMIGRYIYPVPYLVDQRLGFGRLAKPLGSQKVPESRFELGEEPNQVCPLQVTRYRVDISESEALGQYVWVILGLLLKPIHRQSYHPVFALNRLEPNHPIERFTRHDVSSRRRLSGVSLSLEACPPSPGYSQLVESPGTDSEHSTGCCSSTDWRCRHMTASGKDRRLLPRSERPATPAQGTASPPPL